MGPATAPPIRLASAAEATANMSASSATFGATSLISCTIPKVALRTRTVPPPATGASAETRATPGCASPDSSTTWPSPSRSATSVSMALRVKACRIGRSELAGVRAASSAMARASSSAARVAKSDARAVKRSITITANMADSSSVVAARGMNTCRRKERPVRRASTRRAAVAPTPRRNRIASASSSSCLPIAQTVPHPAHRLQHPRVAARLLQLAAQGLDVDVHRPIADDHVAAPDGVEDLAALEDAPRAAQEERQQVELRPGERKPALADTGLARARIQGQQSRAQRFLLGRRALRGAAEDGANARRHLARREGLEHVVVGADLEADHPIGLLVAAGEHDHRDVAAPAQRAEEVEPVSVGEDEIEDHQIGVAGELARLAQRRRLRDLEAVAAQGEGEALADGGLVVDEEDLSHGQGGAPMGPGGFSGCASIVDFSSGRSATARTNLLLRDSTTFNRAPPSACLRPFSRECSTRNHFRCPGPFMKSASVAAGAPGRPTWRTVLRE